MRSHAVVTSLLVAVAACSSHGHDVVGPFTGTTYRYVVDVLAVPAPGGDDPMAIADDLDGGGALNRVGAITTILAGTNDLSVNSADMIASGALASTVTIQAHALTTDDHVGVTFYGADGEPAIVMGGRFAAGAFRSNRTRDTQVPGETTAHLPVFTNADPITVDVRGLEIDLDPDGNGGYNGFVRGGIPAAAAADAAFAGLVQMILDEPQRHLVFARQIDTNADGVIERAEVDASVIGLLLAPDIQLYRSGRYAPDPSRTMKDSLSLAFRIHLAPCAAGRCATAAAMDPCRDRVRDGGETDVDCGGPCQPCQAAAACGGGGDCQSAACDAGRCRAPTCSDGVRDGLETDVDCGDSCAPCKAGATCAAAVDCTSGNCSNTAGSLGTCGP
jgi:hypothetical protein